MLRSIGRAAAVAAFGSAAFTAFGSAAFAQQPAQPPRVAASSFATVEVHVNSRSIGNQWYAEDAAFTGPARIAISYGQPHARGRQVVGKLIPNDTVWRFGANEATTLHTDLDITIGSMAIPRGTYTLFLVHSGSNWNLIVNSQTAQWGTDRNPAKDIGRVPMTARTLTEAEDALTIYLTPDATAGSESGTPSGTLRIKWGTVELSTPWKVKT